MLFLHGLGASARYWERVMEVGGGIRGAAPDLLGFGRSPKPDDCAYDVDDHLAAIVEIEDEPCIVVGHSAGAILAAALAARRPDLVRGVVLAGLPAYADAATARREIGRLGALARWTIGGNPLGHAVCSAMCAMRPLAIAIAPYVIRDLPREIASDGVRHTWPSYSRTLQHVVVEHRSFDDLRRAGGPVRLVHGDADRQAPLRHVQALTDRVAAASVDVGLEIFAADHHLPVRRPDLIVATVANLHDELG